MKWLVMEGDAKLYDILKRLIFDYVSWLIPFPGDFHLLVNYQKTLMKPYCDAGLKELARAAGYPLAAIHSCSQFKRTHQFILESWEALYRVVILQHAQELISQLIYANREFFVSSITIYMPIRMFYGNILRTSNCSSRNGTYRRHMVLLGSICF